MNPLTNIKNQQKLNQTELALGLTGKKSWHDQYRDSAWIFVGGLPFDLTEGDILCVFSQYGEIVNINLVRDQKSGKSKGFCFICYEDQRSTILTVDNLNGIKLLGRMIRVDHVEDYKKPKEHGTEDEITMKLRAEGCAPRIPDSPEEMSSEEEPLQVKVKVKKEKKVKVKKEKKSRKKKKRQSSSSDSDSETTTLQKVKVKKEKHDPGYDKALIAGKEKLKSKRSRSPYETSERQKFLKYNKELSDGGREYNDSERGRERGNRDLTSSDDSYVHQGRDRDSKNSRNNDRDYVDRDSNEALNKEFRDSDRNYNSGRNSRDFDRNQDGRDFDRNRGGTNFDRNRGGRDFDRNRGGRDFDRNRGGRDFDRNRHGTNFDRNRDGRDFDRKRDGRDFDRKRDGRDFDRNQDGRDFDRNQDGRDSGSSRGRKNFHEMDRTYHNRDERVYDKTDSHRRDRRDKYSDD